MDRLTSGGGAVLIRSSVSASKRQATHSLILSSKFLSPYMVEDRVKEDQERVS